MQEMNNLTFYFNSAGFPNAYLFIDSFEIEEIEFSDDLPLNKLTPIAEKIKDQHPDVSTAMMNIFNGDSCSGWIRTEDGQYDHEPNQEIFTMLKALIKEYNDEVRSKIQGQ